MASSRLTAEYDPVSGDIDLNIKYVKPCDSGVYVCTAENTYGSDETFAALAITPVPNVDERPQTSNPNIFNVLDMPLLAGFEPNDSVPNSQPPAVIIPLGDLGVAEGHAALLSCRIAGKPQPKVTVGWPLLCPQFYGTASLCLIRLSLLIGFEGVPKAMKQISAYLNGFDSIERMRSKHSNLLLLLIPVFFCCCMCVCFFGNLQKNGKCLVHVGNGV